MLKVNDLKVNYGVIQAIKGISFEVEDGKIVTLIGGNGAGKTTTMHTISGLIKPISGTIEFENKNINEMSPDNIVKMGLAQCPEGRRVFALQSVEDNLLLGAYLRKDSKQVLESLNEVYKLFPRLLERKKQMAGTLSGGEQQMLAMGRALMSKPKLLLLDEPSMGLSPLLVKEIFNIISKINAQGTSILLVEQNAKMALSIADKAYVLETGKIVMSGSGSELLKSEDIKKSYLGG